MSPRYTTPIVLTQSSHSHSDRPSTATNTASTTSSTSRSSTYTSTTTSSSSSTSYTSSAMASPSFTRSSGSSRDQHYDHAFRNGGSRPESGYMASVKTSINRRGNPVTTVNHNDGRSDAGERRSEIAYVVSRSKRKERTETTYR